MQKPIYYISAAIPVILVFASAVALYVEYQDTRLERIIILRVEDLLMQHRTEYRKANDARAAVFLAQQATIQDLVNQRIERNKIEIANLTAKVNKAAAGLNHTQGK